MAVAAIGGGGLFSGLLGKLISFAISSLFQSLFAPDEPEEPEVEGPLLNKRSNTSPIPVIYGTRRTGGNRVLVATQGNRNEFLHVVLLVCEGEIDGFEKIYLDDSELRFSGALTENSNLNPIGAIENNESGVPGNTGKFGGDLVRIRLHHGSPSQVADSALVSDISNWTTSHELKGRAYIYARFRYDQDTFGGIPTITADVRGKRITLLPGTEGVALTSPATVGYSSNPALCLRDYLINDDYGRGLDPATIDDDKIIEAANYCDESITLQFDTPAGGETSSTGRRYTCDGIVQTDATLYENTRKFLTHMRGFLVFSSGLYRLVLDKAEDSQDFIYDESNIIGSLSVSLGSKKNTLNRMRATFWNPNKNGEDDTIILEPTFEVTSLSTADQERVSGTNLPTLNGRVKLKDLRDNGVTLSREIQLPFCDNPHSARYLVNQEIEQSRQQIHATFQVGLAGLRNEIGDIIRIQHAQMGWGYRAVTVDGEVVLVKNGQITIASLGQTGLFPNWSELTTYTPGGDPNIDTVTFDGTVYTLASGVVTSTNQDPVSNPTVWTEIAMFSQIPNLSSYGLQDLNNDGVNDTNIGVNGKFIYKEFRILSLSLRSKEEVEITTIEYDATVFDNLPLSAIDATPNTSFQNPNDIGPPSNLITTEDLYITTNSGGVKASLTFSWVSPATPFVQAYDIDVHVPEQEYSESINYNVGTKIQFENNRYQALLFNGPNGDVENPGNTTFWSILSGVDDSDFVYLTRTRTQSATVLDAVPGSYDVRVRSVSVTGVSSVSLEVNNLEVLGLIAPPQSITGFGITPQSDLALLQWNASTDLDVRIGGNIEVRHSPVTDLSTVAALQTLWSSARDLTKGKSGVTTQILVPLLTGTYLIKALDSSGIESLQPAAIVNTIQPSTEFNFIQTVPEATAWLGLIPSEDNDLDDNSSGVESFSTTADVLIISQNVTYKITSVVNSDWSSVGGPNPAQVGNIFTVPEGVSATEAELDLLGSAGTDIVLRLDTNNGTAVDAAPVTRTGTYYFGNLVEYSKVTESRLGIDLSFTASNVDAFIDDLINIDDLPTVDGDVPASNLVVEVSTTEVDPSTAAESDWTNYIQFTSGTFNFRAARFRLVINTVETTTQVVVSTCSITVDAADITQTVTDRLWNTTEFMTPGDITNSFDVIYPEQFFNAVSIGVFAEPFLGISADGLLPGDYFVITNTPNGDDDTGLAPNSFRGFRIQFKTVGTTNISGTFLLNAPNSATDGTITRNITFDYQATGF